MTYKAQRYVRHGDGPHECPDAYVSKLTGQPSHNLIRDPGNPGYWVCPYALDQERGEAHRAEQDRLIEEERHERARAIARTMALDEYALILGQPDAGPDAILTMLTDAVLAGMAEERENT